MGWQDNIESIVFTIRTGDGKLFTPLWRPGEYSKEYNNTQFDYINVAGSYVDRKKPKAKHFPLTFWFQGDDNIEQAKAFDVSADDPRVWIIHHPYYGDITGQPTVISYNNVDYNVTEVTVDYWESIVISLPKQSINITDNITHKVQTCHEVSPIDYSSKVKLKPADISDITTFVNKVNARINKILTDADYDTYTQSINNTYNAVDNMLTDSQNGMFAIEDTILQPATFAISVQKRKEYIFAFMADLLQTILAPTRNNSSFFEAAGALVVASYAYAIINPQDGDYVTRNDVLAQANGLSALYSSYLTQLDTLYNADVNPTVAYAASQPTQNAIQDLVLATLSGLSVLAFNAKQERKIITDKDSNLIVLTFRYMGLDPLDANLNTFRTINNIKNNSLFLVPKGTPITYYV